MGLRLISAVLVLLLGLSEADQPLVQPTEEGVKAEEPGHLDITSRILEANKAISHMLMEGDVAVSKKRNAMRCWRSDCRWKKSSNGQVEVPYTISDYFYNNEKTKIERAMESFRTKTCIRFVPHTDQSDYISIESKIGCWSNLGRQRGKQELSLSVFGCIYNGIIQHELLHGLGFYHEHTRSDRDQYVKINWEYIPSSMAINFYKQNTNNLNIPYDYSSVMHYSRTAFASKFGLETITPIPDSSLQIGQREDMSDTDILRINKLYECDIENEDKIKTEKIKAMKASLLND